MIDPAVAGDTQPAAVKKKRSLPGTPDPDAEVIALSPTTLLATNRFVCEICNKGFQRDQNLQLHRRGHNLPWKLRQRSSKEVKKRVYVCPAASCVHHHPSRALGDLTGIKKHFCRKHGEKKWKCDKCSKKYAVQSDWKAHTKICGSREYKCDCGTVFSRKDSFITHRAFCDALAEESAKAQPTPAVGSSTTSPPPPPSSAFSAELQDGASPSPSANRSTSPTTDEAAAATNFTASCSSGIGSSSNGSSSSNAFASIFASSMSTSSQTLLSQPTRFADFFQAIARVDYPIDAPQSSSSETISLCLSTNQTLSIAGAAGQFAPAPKPAMSATALLQKAAQIGVRTSNASLLRGLGIVSSASATNPAEEWGSRVIELGGGATIAAGLGLGIAGDHDGSGLKELMLGTPAGLGTRQTTLDLLGLGMAAGGNGSAGGLSALMTSITGRAGVRK
ncbi:zinc finger protein ENHYDROUS-like [Andrographis paniculata]|uniref:zinc finger protein ENHYDROUS-like n=1 Tax=Andrographis paniculata TaxID=175694 RepID=UPI0021E8FFE6|nr:zinc finger protein ENHYDROUS-like [Andrographis paniculata]